MSRDIELENRGALRVGYFVKRFPRLSETFILQEILEHERQGTHVHIFSLKRPDEAQEHAEVKDVRARVTLVGSSLAKRWGEILRAQAFYAVRSPIRWGRALHLALRGGDRNAFRNFLHAARVARVVETRRLEHLHAHFATGATHLAFLVSTLTGVPFSFTAHARDIYGAHVDRAALKRKLEHAAFVVTVSRTTHAHLQDLAPALSAERIIVIYNGVHPRLLANDAPSMSTRGIPLVLGVGRLVPKKGFDDLLAAAARVRARGCRFRLALLGEGPERAALEERAQREGLRVRFLGARTHDRVLRLMSRARCLVLPCRVANDADRDVLPTVLLEAQALARPVVSTRIEGVPEIALHGEGGFVEEPEDVTALAERLEFLLNNAGEAQRMGLKGRRRMQDRFDIGRSVKELRTRFARSAGRSLEHVKGERLGFAPLLEVVTGTEAPTKTQESAQVR